MTDKSREEEFIELFEKGIDECREGDIDESIESFKRAVEMYPEEGTARVYLARSYMKKMRSFTSEDENYVAALNEIITAVRYLPKDDSDAGRTFKDLIGRCDDLSYDDFNKFMFYWIEHNPDDYDMAFWGCFQLHHKYKKHQEAAENLLTVLESIHSKYDVTPEEMLLNIEHSLTNQKKLFLIDTETQEVDNDAPPYTAIRIKKTDSDIIIEFSTEDTFIYQSSQLLLFMLLIDHIKDVHKARLIFISIWQVNLPLAKDILLPMMVETQIDHGHRYIKGPTDMERIDHDSKEISEQWAVISQLETRLRLFIFSVLRKRYNENWWKKGVSKRIRAEAEWRQSGDSGREPNDVQMLSYIDLIQCKNIIYDRWESVFERYFGKVEDDLTHWLDQINCYRRILAHNTRPLKSEEYSELKDIASRLFECINNTRV